MRFNFEATGIGSTPYKDARIACRVIAEHFKDIPFWPQLPQRAFLENMYAQFSERFPGMILDEKKKSMHVDTLRLAKEAGDVLAKYLEEDLEYFRISEDRAEGLHEFLASPHSPSEKFVKGQVTGPASFALSVTDENKKAIIYDKAAFEVATKFLLMKARWQVRALKKRCADVIIFIDEPYLVSIGSSYVNIDKAEIAKSLDEIAGSLKKDGALVGVHCCGNTDWGFLLERDIDMISFDAYNFINEFALYAVEIGKFLKRGGAIAWGIVPTSEVAKKESPSTLIERLSSGIKSLVDKGIDKSVIQSIVSPSCGLGTLSTSFAEKIFAITGKIPDGLR